MKESPAGRAASGRRFVARPSIERTPISRPSGDKYVDRQSKHEVVLGANERPRSSTTTSSARNNVDRPAFEAELTQMRARQQVPGVSGSTEAFGRRLT